MEFALFIPRSGTPFWKSQVKFAQAAATDLGVSLKFYSADNQSRVMLRQVEEACQQGIDGVLFMNYEQIGEQILSITERYKVPSILYNTVFTSSDLIPRTKYQHWIGSVTPYDEEAGVHLAEQLLLKAKEHKLKQINMLVVNGNMKEISAQQRNQGLNQFIKHHPNISIVAEVDTGTSWSRNESKRQFIKHYRQNPEINLVWAASDSLGLGVLDAITELSLPKGSIIVGGIDWQPEALQAIKNRLIIFQSVGISLKLRGDLFC